MDPDPRTPGEGSVEAMLKAGDRQGRKRGTVMWPG